MEVDGQGRFWARIDHFRTSPSPYPPARRLAVRAVVRDGGLLLLVHSAKLGDYKFPGGGVEAGEGPAEALARELREETGCLMTGDPAELGQIDEHWFDPGASEPNFSMVSRYFRVAVSGERIAPELEGYEAELGFRPCWLRPSDAVACQEALMDNPPPGLRSWIRRETLVLRTLLEREES